MYSRRSTNPATHCDYVLQYSDCHARYDPNGHTVRTHERSRADESTIGILLVVSFCEHHSHPLNRMLVNAIDRLVYQLFHRRSLINQPSKDRKAIVSWHFCHENLFQLLSLFGMFRQWHQVVIYHKYCESGRTDCECHQFALVNDLF